jgi:hypothetical protein
VERAKALGPKTHGRGSLAGFEAIQRSRFCGVTRSPSP